MNLNIIHRVKQFGVRKAKRERTETAFDLDAWLRENEPAIAEWDTETATAEMYAVEDTQPVPEADIERETKEWRAVHEFDD